MNIDFAKLNGCGNDFIMIEDLADKVHFTKEQVARMCDRHFGIGADGVIVVKPSLQPACAAYMDYYNSDGTKAQMCGNGVRCFAKFIVDGRLVPSSRITVDFEPDAQGTLVADTLAGPRTLRFSYGSDGKVGEVRVDMGQPILDPVHVPTTLVADAARGAVVEAPVSVGAHEHAFTCVSMGNPHAVTFVDDVESFPVEEVGPLFEAADVFPEKANIEFAAVHGDEIDMRVWERGCGETLACGTGSCATVVAAVLTGRSDRTACVHLLGGDLHVEWSSKDNHVYMTGPASESFRGTFDSELFA